jgi:Cu(I)/Ag(I) efflux system membrane protein CusA/SilA
MWLLGYNLSVAVAVGFIALAGVAAETGVVMLIYLDHAWEAVKATSRESGRSPNVSDLYSRDGRRRRARAPEDDDRRRHHGRPLADHVGTGTGSEVMSRIAAPMVGGMISSTVLTLAVIPAIYALVKQWRLDRGQES